MTKQDYDATVARIAGNLLAGTELDLTDTQIQQKEDYLLDKSVSVDYPCIH